MKLARRNIEYRIENRLVNLFILIIIISQGSREILNNITNTSIFNYHLIPLFIIFFMMVNKKNEINKVNFILVIGISGLLLITAITNKYDVEKFLRVLMGFFMPLNILFLNYKDINLEYFFKKIIKIFNLYIYISFILALIEFFVINNMQIRTGGIIGHPLTAGWYYVIFISLNCIYSKYFKRKRDIFIIADIFLALIGTVIAAGRISMLMAIIISMIYIVNCSKSKFIAFLGLPFSIGIFISSPIVDQLIWEKFRYAAQWGDITNGRLLGIREMEFFDIYPQVVIGQGIGYSNYLTKYIFGTINFENPILMFAFDYGIFTVCLLMILLFIYPISQMLKKRNILLMINFIIIFIIPFTYNGLAETIGIFIVLIFIIYIFLVINENI